MQWRDDLQRCSSGFCVWSPQEKKRKWWLFILGQCSFLRKDGLSLLQVGQKVISIYALSYSVIFVTITSSNEKLWGSVLCFPCQKCFKCWRTFYLYIFAHLCVVLSVLGVTFHILFDLQLWVIPKIFFV